MKYASRASRIADDLRASAISLLISLQSIVDIQSANVEIAENSSLDEDVALRHRRFAEVLSEAFRAGIDALGVAQDEYEAELARIEQDEPSDTFSFKMKD